MPHRNKIIDADAHFVVNAITRQIENKTPSKITLMQNDHNSERFTFSVPRYIEGHDMLEVSKAEVHFLNGDSVGIYGMKDLAIDPKDENKVICSWLLANNATKNVGLLDFSLKFTCFDDDGITPNYVWNTVIFSGISISKSLDNSGTVAEDNVDVLEQWRQEFIQKEEKNTAGGVAGLDENGKISADQIPAGSGGGGSITVDDKFDIDSTNPIQNKVVANFVETAVMVFNIENEGTSEENIWSKNYNGSAVETHLPLVSRLYVDNAIGDIETALENIITKYGLGGDSV